MFAGDSRSQAVGINREVHFSAGSEAAADRIGDTLAPKDFWGDFVRNDGKKTGGLQDSHYGAIRDRRATKVGLDGKPGQIQVKIDAPLRVDIPYPISVQVNDHYDLANGPDKLSDGRTVAELVTENFKSSVANSERLIDHIMELSIWRSIAQTFLLWPNLERPLARPTRG